MADGLVPVVVSPVPFSRQIHDLTVREGATVLAMLVEAVRAGKLGAADLSRVTIYLDGERLPRDEALDVVLSTGQIVNVVVEPLGGGHGGGKDVGQIILSIAVIAVSAWVGGGAGGMIAGSIMRAVAAATVMTLGQAALGALFTPDRDAQAKANDRYALQSASNQYRPWAPFPMALGEVVVAPDLAVKTFTQTRGDDIWIYGILGLHYGACEVSEEKIGDTLASTMGAGDIQFVRHLTPGPRTFQLYPNDVDQLDLTEELEATPYSATPLVRAGSAEGEKFEFDFFLPQGLYFQKDDGRVLTTSVTMTIRYRAVDRDGAPIGAGTWSNGLTIPLSSTTKEPWRITRALSLPLGRYEFEIKRSLKPDDNEKRRDQVALTAIRSIAFRKPITDETLAIIEFAVRATALNQGTLAPITCRIKPLCQAWDPEAGAWSAPQATSNPAALTRWLLSGPAPVRPEAPERVDVGLRAWSELCETYDWTTNVYLTELKTQAEAMALLEQAGRASLFWDGTQIVASPWVEKPSPVQMFAGDNLRDHKWTMAYVEPVHALRVEFQNLDQGGEPDELYVYADGYAETAGGGKEAAVLIEALRLEGQRTEERAYRDGRWELGRRLHQRRVDTWTCDIEQLAARYGSRVRLAWQRVDSGASARVRVRRWSGELVAGLRLTQPVTMLPGESYAVDLRLVDGVDTAVPIINVATSAPVTTRDIAFAAPRAESAAPRAGDLVAFGIATKVSEDVEIIGIEPGEGLTATLTGVRYVAPLLMAGETGPIPELQTRLTRVRAASPPPPRLLGVQPDPSGVRVSFEMPPWSGSPIAGFSARWRPTPAEGNATGWVSLQALGRSAMTLVTPPIRALPVAPDDIEGRTLIDVEVRAFTEAGQSSPEPLLVTSIEVREDPWPPVQLVVTPAVRVSEQDGSSHGVLHVAATPLAASDGVDMVVEVRVEPVNGEPGDWDPATRPLPAANPQGDLLGLLTGERYRTRAAWRSAGGWLSEWADGGLATVPADSNVASDSVNTGGRPSTEVAGNAMAVPGIAQSLEQVQQSVTGLVAIYGDTVSAANSAASAAASEAAAIAAKADTLEAKGQAVAAAGAAASSSSQAAGYLTATEQASAAASTAAVSATANYAAARDAARVTFPQVISSEYLTRSTSGTPGSGSNLEDQGVVDSLGFLVNVDVQSYAAFRTYVPFVVGRIYEVTYTVEGVAGSSGHRPYAYALDSSFANVGGTAGAAETNINPGVVVTKTARFGMGVTPTGGVMIADDPARRWVRFGALVNRGSGTGKQMRLRALALRDVTELAASEAQAAASSSSASTASAKATEAAASATAAQTDRVAAQTARTGSEAARDLAVTAKQDAQGAASTAAAQQALATTAKNDAQSAATASAGSASLSDSRATAAGVSASSAAASQVAASASYSAAALAAGAIFPETIDAGWLTSSITGDPATRPAPTTGTIAGAALTSAVGSNAVVMHKAVVPWSAGKIYEVSLDSEAIAATGGTVQAAPYARALSATYATTAAPEVYTFTPLTVAQRTTLTRRFGMGVTPTGGSQITNPGNDNAFVRFGSLVNYGSAADRQSKLYRLTVRDVTALVAAETQANAAATQAATASAQATLAGEKATAASGSAVTANTAAGQALAYRDQSATSEANSAANAAAASLSAGVAASVSTGAMNQNPTFADWPTQTAETAPNGWVEISTANGVLSRVPGMNGSPNAVRTASAGTANHGIQQAAPYTQGASPGGEYLVVEVDFTLVSGSLVGSGILLSSRNESSSIATSVRRFDTEKDASGTVRGAGVAGSTYRYRFLIDARAAGVTRYHVFGMCRYGSAGFPAPVGACTIDWHRIGYRAATQEEITAGVAYPGLAATVAANSAVTADYQTQKAKASYEVVSAATGDLPAILRLLSVTGGGGYAALIAPVVALMNQVDGTAITALKAVLGDVFVFNKLFIGTAKQIVLDPTYPAITWQVGAGKLAIGKLTNQGLLFWFGPSQSIANMTKANATLWLDSNGDGYFGGTITQGAIEAEAFNTSLALATVSTPSTASNGNPITVQWSYAYSKLQSRSSKLLVAHDGTSSVTVKLYRKIGSAAETLVDTKVITGSVEDTYYDVNATTGIASMSETQTGAWTYTDTAGGATARIFRVEVSAVSHASQPGATETVETIRFGAKTSE